MALNLRNALVDNTNPADTLAFVQRHVARGSFTAAQLAAQSSLKMIDGNSIPITSFTSGTNTLVLLSSAQSNAVNADNQAGNGLVHVMDTIMAAGVPSSDATTTSASSSSMTTRSQNDAMTSSMTTTTTSTPTPSTTVAASTGIDMLQPTEWEPTSLTLSSGVLSLDGRAGVRLASLPASSGALTILLEFTATSRGYLLSRTDGLTRYYALFASTSTMRLDFSPATGPLQSVSFNASVLDGERRQAALVIDDDEVTLHLDGAVFTQTLSASVQDCTASSLGCVLALGENVQVVSSQLALTGSLSIAFYYRVALTASEVERVFETFISPTLPPLTTTMMASTTPAVVAVDVLRGLTSVSEPQANAVTVPISGAVIFDGQNVLRVTELPPVATNDRLSLSVNFTLARAASSYLISKSNAAGNIRYYAIFASNNSVTVSFKSTASASTTTREFTSAIALDDGRVHSVVMEISFELSVTIDGVRQTASLPSNFELEDCASGIDCVLYLGARATVIGPQARLTGSLHMVELEV
eukprot:TRINITY_DN11342_c1_g4_i1.p1 TRINITY_DN11342_c1_g4~~TRINITY_DN11342_c1_g4_i1.p1  ORF type:complete len:528 (+),score=136.91 TRINITY_DN11342_c1_g4_i1:1219-2802(+)